MLPLGPKLLIVHDVAPLLNISGIPPNALFERVRPLFLLGHSTCWGLFLQVIYYRFMAALDDYMAAPFSMHWVQVLVLACLRGHRGNRQMQTASQAALIEMIPWTDMGWYQPFSYAEVGYRRPLSRNDAHSASPPLARSSGPIP